MKASDPSSCYERLHRRGFTLQPVPQAIGNFQHYVQEGTLFFLSGQGPLDDRGNLLTGKVGDTVSLDEAYDRARRVGLNLLSVMHDALGDLGRVRRVVRLFGMVNAVPDFTQHSLVINGCSDLFVDILGEAGRHARSALGVASLPNNISVEIEAVIAV
jgi:enamine deaminase RidA (YjgF/YER057c/UK114 family)